MHSKVAKYTFDCIYQTIYCRCYKPCTCCEEKFDTSRKYLNWIHVIVATIILPVC